MVFGVLGLGLNFALLGAESAPAENRARLPAAALQSPWAWCVGVADGDVESNEAAKSTRARAGVDDGIWNPTSEPVVIDVLLLYSKAAVAAEGSEARLRSRLLTAVESANFCFTNSLVGVRLNPVWMGPQDWTESGSLISDWLALQTDARVAALRRDTQADLIYLVVEQENFGFGGTASLPPAGGNPARAFCVLRRTALIGEPRWAAPENSIYFVHETGHLLGAQHDREHAVDAQGGLGRGAFDYSYGHRLVARGVTYTTIMGYDPGIPLPYFSNPRLRFEGVPLGVEATAARPSDNAQTLNRLAPFVAQYRTAASRIIFGAAEYRVREGTGPAHLELRRVGDLRTATQVKVVFESGGTAMAGQDFTAPATALVEFAVDQSLAEVLIPIQEDAVVEGDETVRVQLRQVVGNHGVGLNSRCELIIEDRDADVTVTPSTLVLTEGGTDRELMVEYRGALESGASASVSVDLRVSLDGTTATPGVDVDVPESLLVFTPESRQQVIRLRAWADQVAEPDESLSLVVGSQPVAVRIKDAERPGALLPVASLNGAVSALVALPDGGVVAAGDFTEVDGSTRTGVVRLRADGSLDPAFVPPSLQTAVTPEPGLMAARVNCLVPASQGRWWVGGFIGFANGEPAQHLIRLKSDGQLDATFAAESFDGAVWTVLEQPDGKLVVGGAFEHVGGEEVRGLVRLNPDGSRDATFQLGSGLSGSVAVVGALAALPDGRLLVGGLMEKYQGTSVQNLLRLHPDGRLDDTFPLLTTGASGVVTAVAVLPDGRAWVGGYFDLVGGRRMPRLARLTATGELDGSVISPRPDGEIYQMVPLPSGQLLVGGLFTRIAGVERRYLALLNSDGRVDSSFDLGTAAGNGVWSVAAGGLGSLWVGGALTQFNEQSVGYLARVRLPALDAAWAGVELQRDGSLRARVIGLPGASYPWQSSADYNSWRPAGTVEFDSMETVRDLVLPVDSDQEFFRLPSRSNSK